jgi:hypothetical protein
MTIKHNEAQELFGVTYRKWLNDYLKTERHKNYTVTHAMHVFELHQIDPITGDMKFSQLMDEKEANQTKRQDPKKFHIKKLEYKYYDRNLAYNEDYFRLYPNSSLRPYFDASKVDGIKNSYFFDRLFKVFKYIKPKSKLDRDSVRHITIVSLMIITIVAMFVIAYFQGVFN